MARTGAAALDDVDRKILRAFQIRARSTNSEVARKVGISEGTVRRRLAALHDAGVLEFSVLTDPRAMGLLVDCLIGITADGDKVERIADQLASLPAVRYAAISMGAVDIWVRACFASVEGWLEFRTRLGGIDGIRSTETFQLTRELKRNFEWAIPEDGTVIDEVSGARGN